MKNYKHVPPVGAMIVNKLTTLALLLIQPNLWSTYGQCTNQAMSEIWASLPECNPRETLVPVIPPADPNILGVIPSQVLVARCLGTCHLQVSSRYHRCVPSNVYNTTVKVLLEKIVLEEDSAPVVVEVCSELQVEAHTSCLCGCEEINCTAAQVYDHRTCSCRCRNHSARGQCLVQHNKVWDSVGCGCHCHPDELMDCSTGFSYDPDITCSCVRIPSSIPSRVTLVVLGILLVLTATSTVILSLLLFNTNRSLKEDVWQIEENSSSESDQDN